MTKIYELCGYLGIALTIIGQILIGLDYFCGAVLLAGGECVVPVQSGKAATG